VAQKNLRATNARRAPSPRSLANHDQLTHVNGKDWLMRQLARKNEGGRMMGYRIFLAGASGAIGSRLTPLLHSALAIGFGLFGDYTSQFPCSDTPSLPFECTKNADCSVVV
jgi:hypothetical protein